MNILILRLSSLGDVVLLSGVLEAIRKTHPEARIHCLTKPAYVGVLAGHPCVDSVIAYEGFWSAWSVLRRKTWDALLDLHGVPRTRLLSWAVPARRKAVYEKDTFKRRWLVLSKGPGFGESVLERYRQAALKLGLIGPSQNVRHHLPDLKKGGTEDTINFLMNPSEPSFKVGFAPGARWNTKRWLPERFSELARLIRTEHPDSQFLLIGSEEDKGVCEEIASQMKDFKPMNLAGSLSIPELMRVISQCALFITNDSGPMHIASGYGVPTVAVFGPTVRGFGFFPQGPRSRVVEAELACRPCSLHGSVKCPRGHFLCMRLISAAEVFKACREAMA